MSKKSGFQRDARILVVDDEASNVRVFERTLQQAGYGAVKGVTDPREVLPLFGSWDPQIIILDLHMPHSTDIK